MIKGKFLKFSFINFFWSMHCTIFSVLDLVHNNTYLICLYVLLSLIPPTKLSYSNSQWNHVGNSRSWWSDQLLGVIYLSMCSSRLCSIVSKVRIVNTIFPPLLLIVHCNNGCWLLKAKQKCPSWIRFSTSMFFL